MKQRKDTRTWGSNPAGCVFVTNRALNQDGYYRVNVNGVLVMYHRLVWERACGAIPQGYEVDHTCRNRACCNIRHLQLLTRADHLDKTNRERYAARHEEAYAYWLKHKPTGVALAARYSVTFSTGCRWIREWKGNVQRSSRKGVVEG